MIDEVKKMARRCPECGTFLVYLGTGEDKKTDRRPLARFWCPYDGNYVVFNGIQSEGKVKAPKIARAYLEFAKYLHRDASGIRWRTLFFQMNDPSKLGVMLDSILGVHGVHERKNGLFTFYVTTTNCSRIPFDYLSEPVATRDRERLIREMEIYHVPDAQG